MSGTLSFLCGVSLWEVRNPQKQAQVLAEHPCPLVTCRMKVRKGPQASFGTNCGGAIKSLPSQLLCPAVLVRFKDPVSEWPLEGRGLLAWLNLRGLGPWGLTSIPFRSLSWFPLENECGLCSDGGWREKAALSQGFENNSPVSGRRAHAWLIDYLGT